MKPNQTPQLEEHRRSIEETLFDTILHNIEASLETFCQLLEALCEHLLGISKALLQLMYFGSLLYATLTWIHSPDPTPKMILAVSCLGLIGVNLGQWALAKNTPLRGIKLPILTLILVQTLPLEFISKIIKNL